MRFVVLDFGSVEREALRLQNAEVAALNPEPPMIKILADMYRIERINFNSWGHRGGGSWAQLKDDTVRKKGASQILKTSDAYPGYWTTGMPDALFNSMTDPEAPYAIGYAAGNTIVFGTDRPAAFVHQFGSRKRNIPRRPFIKFLPNDLARWRQMIYDHLLRPHMVK